MIFSRGKDNSATFSVPGYPSNMRKMDAGMPHDGKEFIPVAHHQALLAQMMHSHVPETYAWLDQR